MDGGHGPETGLIVYVDRSDIRPGRLQDLKAGVRRLVAFIESHEPRLLDYGVFIDEEAGRMTVVHVHADSASLERHAELGGPEFRRLAELIDLRQIEVFGRVSDRAEQLLRDKAHDLGHGGVSVQVRFAGTTPGSRPIDSTREA